MGFLKVFALELTSNIPVWLGFIVAIKLLYESKSRWWQSLLVLYGSAVLTAACVLLFEPVKLGEDAMGQFNLFQLLALAGVFTLVGVPFLWYIATTIKWITWRTDLVLAALLGVTLTAGEALVVQVFEPRVLIMHAVSMAAAAGVTIPLMRWLKSRSWKVAIEGVLVVAVVASAIIVAIEYMPRPTLADNAGGISESTE